jgi:DNA replication protein DnaC
MNDLPKEILNNSNALTATLADVIAADVVVNDMNKKLIEWLSGYELRRKGLLLIGNTGSGKTSLLKAYLKMANCKYAYIPSIRLAQMFETGGIGGFEQQYNDELFGKRAVFIDDLGAEPISNHYGNKVESAELWIGKFYEKYSIRSNAFIPVFGTSNLTMNEIGERYGDRIRYRIEEMCHVWVLGGDVNYTNFRKK